LLQYTANYIDQSSTQVPNSQFGQVLITPQLISLGPVWWLPITQLIGLGLDQAVWVDCTQIK